MNLSERIQELRKKDNHSQEELANMLNISRQAVSKWESGQVQPELDNLIKLSKIYNVSTDYLLTGEDAVIKTEDELNSQVSSKTKNIIAIIGASAAIAFVVIVSLLHYIEKLL